MATTKATTVAVLELPGKGTFAPNKFGSGKGDFLKTDIPGQPQPLWIFKGKLYPIAKQEEIDEFNEMCATLVPHCHRRKLRVTPRILIIPGDAKPRERKKPEPKGKGGIKRKNEKPKAEKPEPKKTEEPKTPEPVGAGAAPAGAPTLLGPPAPPSGG